MSYKRKLSAFNGGRPALRRVATVLLGGVSLLVLSMNPGFAEADGKFLDAKSCEDNLQLNSNSTDEGWPAPGSEDTELGVFMGPEVSHGATTVYTRVQA